MELERAEIIANQVKEWLASYCEKIMVAGSIRRRRPFVHDIDIVCIPSSQGQFITACQKIGTLTTKGQLQLIINGVTVDLYIADEKTWATLLLVRTGSKEHNVMLCKTALRKGLRLHADGSGLFKDFERVAGDSEQSIFHALGLPYKRPEERN